MKKYNIIIIGAGPAGLFSAINIPDKKKILIIEKNNLPGKKLLISGKNQCNLTHSGDINNFYNHYGKNGRFLKPALLNLNNTDLIKYFKTRGVEFIQDKNNKFFPKSLQSEELLEILKNEIIKKNIEIKYHCRVTNIFKENQFFKIEADSQNFYSEKIIIATGGKSYPKTGSTGDGQNLAEKLGHSIIKMQPGLAPIFIKNHSLSSLSGNSFNEISISQWRDNKKINSLKGDLLITHKGLSGPVILDNSRYFKNADILKINFLDSSEDILKNKIQETIISAPSLKINSMIKRWNLPGNLKKQLLHEADINSEMSISELGKKRINRLIQTFTEFPVEINSTGDFNIAMVTVGGVNIKEVNSKTMESKIIKNLFFAGEILDIDGDTGGYNLQAAFSTGYLAGISL